MKSLFSRLKSGPDKQSPGQSSSSSSSARPQSSQSHHNDKENVHSQSGIPAKKRSTSTFGFNKSSRNPHGSQSLRSPTPILTRRSGASSPPSNTIIPIGSGSRRPHSVNGPLPTLTVHDGEDAGAGPIAGSWEEEITKTRAVSASEGGVGLGLGIAGTGAAYGAGDRKKVTFRSPAPTPAVSVVLDDAADVGDLGEEYEEGNPEGRASSRASSRPATSTSPTKQYPSSSTSALRPLTLVPPSAFSRPSSAQSMISSRPRPSSRQSSPFLPSFTPRPPQIRKSSLPPLSQPFYTSAQSSAHPQSASPTKSSIMCPTPSEASGAASNGRSYLASPNSWTEMAGEELVANLGPKERTRQEVLWEIVSSEERYVQDLIRLNETFCRQLLPPSAISPHLELFDITSTLTRAYTRSPSSASPALLGESLVNLPIAAKFASTGRQASTDIRHPSNSSVSTAPPMTPNEEQIIKGTGLPSSTTARMNAYNILTNGRPSEPDHKSSFSFLQKGRTHNSLPPPPRAESGSRQSSSSGYRTRMSFHPGSLGNKLHKQHDGSRNSSGASIRVRDVQLPEDLEKVLTVLSGGIVEGHSKLAAALRRRYDDQFPLVRSLADVFTAHSNILREYADYVLHLEKALSQVDEALAIFADPAHPHSAKPAKRLSRRMEESELGRLGRVLLSLEELAAERGESGLIISLSKPFQRLLKYPLLFQNLLFNTDPSLKEYEATLTMVDEVEMIVRQIEDEKSSSEERENTRDVWARIDGLEMDKILMAPKPDRLLLSEMELPMPDNVELKVRKDASVSRKKSLRRFSDMIKGHGGHSDLWVVRFSDVSILCERIGTTQLPVSTIQKSNRSNSSSDMGTKAKQGSAKRSSAVRARNLYRFVKVHDWHTESKKGSSLEATEPPRAHWRSGQTTPHSPLRTKSVLPSIPGTPHAPLTRMPVKNMDGPRSFRASSATSRLGDNDTDSQDSDDSDDMSEMSFVFRGSDEVEPIDKKVAPLSLNTPSVSGSRSVSAVSGGRLGVGDGTTAPTLQRRSSGGHVSGSAANAKFAHRLRSSALDQHPLKKGTGLSTKTRRSLPPAMTTARPLQTPSIKANRPAWNSGLSTTSTMRTSTPASSIRGARSPPLPPAPPALTKSGGSREPQTVKKSPSTDSAVAGMWKAYGQGEGIGFSPSSSSAAIASRKTATSAKAATLVTTKNASTTVAPASTSTARNGIGGAVKAGMRSSRSTSGVPRGADVSSLNRRRELGGKI
ncbi:hypothetical protein IAR55_002505 [Kwoniella newhampshirensis]|uniref:DH domain-containing protein n=1 Tax=Kwoniella newhampshirensis TaxID=1651941 RepID=A0AAW0Z1P2_9TREE